jgi:cytochrome d ubiquinol oxidase subunit I
MIAIALIMLYITYRKKPFPNWKILKWFPLVILFPYLANTGGWLLTELGRQPWVVYGLMKTENAMSPTLSSGMVLTTLIGFTLLYGLLMVADIYLLIKFAKGGLENLALVENEETRGA